MFTPTAEKLVPDLTPREELVVLARALWREGYNDHLAGHITVNLGDGTLLCNPWLLTWAELRPSQVLRIDLDGRVVEGDWPVPLGHPAAPRAAQVAPGRGLGGAQPSPLRHGVGGPGRGPPDPRPELGAGRRHAGPDRRVRGARQRRLERAVGGGEDGRRVHGAAGRARRVRPGRLGPGRAPARGGAGATVPARLVRQGGRRCGGRPGSRSPSSTWWRRATARASSASGRPPCAPSWRPIPICSTRLPERRRRGPEDLVQLHRHRGVELAVGARRRARGRGASARRTWRGGNGPAAGGRRRPRTTASGRSGSQVMSLPAFQRFAPAGRPAGGLGLGPPGPRVVLQGVLPVGLELGDQLAPAGHAEARGHADVVQRPGRRRRGPAAASPRRRRPCGCGIPPPRSPPCAGA